MNRIEEALKRAGQSELPAKSVPGTRRELFTPIPAGTMLDDVYWPLCVAMKGKRVIHADRAFAYDRLPEVRCPVTVACGAASDSYSVALVEALVERLPRARTLKLDPNATEAQKSRLIAWIGQ